MKKFTVIFIPVFIACMLIAGNAGAIEKGIRVKGKSGESIYLYKDYHALVVGVGNYDFWPDLQGALKDAKEVEKVLTDSGIKTTLLLDPTSEELKVAMNRLTYEVGKEENRAILFFFSGHGETEDLATDEKLGYIVPKDCPTIARDRSGFIDKAISMNTVETYALRIKSKHVLMLFDSCFSGSVFASLKGVPTDISEKSNRPVRQFITAGNEEEQVPDESIFKTCFLQGIKGEADSNRDGYVTGSELGMYLDSSVVNYSRGYQHPQYGKIRHPKLDKGDFIFKIASSGSGVYSGSDSGKTLLTVEGNPTGAKVYIDSRYAGNMPLKDIEVSPGSRRLRVSKDGYEDYQRPVEVEKGRSVSMYIDLSPVRQAKARLYVDTEPGGADVRILNLSSGYYQGMELEPGRYNVEASASGYEKKEIWVDVAAGEDKRISIRLEPVEEKTFTNSIGMKFVKIPAGSFMMGSSISASEVVSKYGGKEEWYKGEHPQHQVTISRPFYMQSTEVTVGQWRSFIKDTGYRTEAETGGGAYTLKEGEWEKREGAYWDNPGFSQTDRHPVTCVSWNDAREFIKWLNGKEGGKTYRLPTEAEWEYGCRAGSTSRFCFGDSDSGLGQYAWYSENSGGRTHPVAEKQPNFWGLYDMHGNVWEWCEDRYGDYPASSVTDPAGPSSGSFRVLRGGGWYGYAWSCRSASRYWDYPGFRINGGGFRLVLAQVR